MVWILGRIYCTGTPEDYEAVHALQDQFAVVPLSAYGKPYTPPSGCRRSRIRHEDGGAQTGQRAGRRRVLQSLAQLMKTNPPTAQDAPMVARMAKIGLVPGQDFDPSKLASSTGR